MKLIKLSSFKNNHDDKNNVFLTVLIRFIKTAFFIGLLFIFDAVFYEPYTLKIKSYTIYDNQLKGIKVVFATDFHIAPYKWEEWRLKNVIKTINDQNPDLVILGGDYVNRHSKKTTMHPKKIVGFLQNIKAHKVAVLGNHDSYYGKEDVKKYLEDAGIPVLDNKNVKLSICSREVYIAGTSDYDTDNPDVYKALQNSDNPLIFVTHSPDVFMNLNGKTNIAFAGHTHGGQIVFPFFGALAINTVSGRKYTYGLFYENNRPLIVSSGLGTSVVPIRFNNRPEIVVVEFR